MLSPYFKVEVTIFARLLSNLYVSQIFLFNYAIWLWILLRVKWSYLDKKGILNLSSTCVLSWLLTWASFFQMSLNTKVASESESEVAQSCPTLRPHGLQPIRLLRPWDFPGKSAEWIAISFSRGSSWLSKSAEWIAISFSRGSSWLRTRTRVSLIAGRRFAVWATRGALSCKVSRKIVPSI